MNSALHPVQPSNRPAFSDLVAGLSVALVLVPQSIAYATLAGLPPVHGLYASVLPPIIAALFASSPFLQTGPVAITSVLTLGALSTLAVPFSSEYIAWAAMLALVVGIVRLLLGLLRAGFMAYLMSEPVLNGFTAAAALLIIASQLPAALGVPGGGHGVMPDMLEALAHPGSWSGETAAISAITLAVIIGGRRLHTLFPGVLIAVLAGIAWSRFGGYAGEVIGDIPAGLPQLSIALPWQQLPQLIVPGIVIALVGFAEPAAIARTMATQTRQRWSADRELVSQGAANIAAGLSGAFPVGGSFSRTTLNRSAGGQSRWSGAVTGLAVLAVLPFADVLSPLPQAVLAATVIAAVLKLVQLLPMVRLIGVSRAQAAVAWTTFALTLALAPRVDLAVLIGIGLGIAVHLWRERRAFVNASYESGTLRLEAVGVIYFGSIAAFDDAMLSALAAHPETERLVLDLRKVGRIDYTGAQLIKRVVNNAESAALGVTILPGQPLQGVKLLKRVLGEDAHCFRDHP